MNTRPINLQNTHLASICIRYFLLAPLTILKTGRIQLNEHITISDSVMQFRLKICRTSYGIRVQEHIKLMTGQNIIQLIGHS